MTALTGLRPDRGRGAASGDTAGGRPSLLRRNAGVLLVTGGAFLVTLALLLRFYVYAQLALIPAHLELEWQLEDATAVYLDTATWELREDAEVVRRTVLTGAAAPGNSDWTSWTMTTTTAGANGIIGHGKRRVIVDRATGRAVNCCGEHVDGDYAVRQAGLVLYWPAGAERREFPFYDTDIRAAPPMRYDGTATIAGVEVRRYVQHIDATQVPGSTRPVPARAMDTGRSGTVEATRWLELTRTYWIEPVTGRLVSTAEQRHETLRTVSGDGELTLLKADLRMPVYAAEANAAAAARQALVLRLVREWLPLAFTALGPGLLAVGLVRLWVVARREGTGEAGPEGSDRSGG